MVFFWMVVLLLALLAYVILDGYDLGIGTLTLIERDGDTRRGMLDVVGNVWDGNESWLILLAMGLWAGFPDAYASALPGLYLPLCLMLFALIFRASRSRWRCSGRASTGSGGAYSGLDHSWRLSLRVSCSADC